MNRQLYQEMVQANNPIVGAMDIFGATNLYIVDPDLIRNIVVKDFDHFVNNRGVQTSKSSKYFSKMLFIMKNEQWKGVRAKLTPTFTTGKIKRMFAIFQNSNNRMNNYTNELIGHPQNKQRDLDMQKLFFKFGMDVIANCAFGVESQVWKQKLDNLSIFEQMAKKLEFRFDGLLMLKFMLVVVAPKVADFFEVEVLDNQAQQYFAGLIKEMLRQRRQSGERKEDFLQLIMDAQQGILKMDEDAQEVDKEVIATAATVTFTDEDLVANALLFFFAGFDTTQTVLIYTLYSLALEQHVQEKLYEEVKGVTDKTNGQISYDAVMEMTYLDCVINGK